MDNIIVRVFRIILKQLSAIIPIKFFNKLFKTNSPKRISISEKAAQVINRIGDPLKYQRNLRSEY